MEKLYEKGNIIFEKCTEASMKDITYLQIEPTTKCNFACIFCCRNKLEQRDMNIDLFKQVLEELQQIHHIHIQGEGEPLLHPDIIEMFQFARQKAYVLTTITNGSLLSKYYKALVDCEIDRIGISIETVDKERFRKIRGGSLDAVIKGIKQVVQYKKDSGKLKPALGFEVALLKDNLSELKRISDLYRDLEMDGGISVQPLNTTPFYFDNYDDYLKEQIKRIEQIIEYEEKMDKAHSEKKKNYYKEGMEMLFQEGENFENIHKIYHEYQTAFLTRKEIVDKLYEEIRIIKKLQV